MEMSTADVLTFLNEWTFCYMTSLRVLSVIFADIGCHTRTWVLIIKLSSFGRNNIYCWFSIDIHINLILKIKNERLETRVEVPHKLKLIIIINTHEGAGVCGVGIESGVGGGCIGSGCTGCFSSRLVGLHSYLDTNIKIIGKEKHKLYCHIIRRTYDGGGPYAGGGGPILYLKYKIMYLKIVSLYCSAIEYQGNKGLRSDIMCKYIFPNSWIYC